MSDFEGLAEFQKNIDKIIKTMGSDKAADIVFEAAKIGRDAVKNNAPVGKTGNLKKSIVAHKFAKQNKLSPAAFIGIWRGTGEGSGRHAHLLEFGTVKMKKRPFFRRGIRGAQSDMFNKMAKEASALISHVRTKR